MARQELDKENLLRDATAFDRRVELRVIPLALDLFVGFRKNGCVSLYFGQDIVYHFNSKDQLRRAYLAPLLLKAEQGQLVTLKRRRTEDQSQLLRKELDETESATVIRDARRLLDQLFHSIERNEYTILGQFPEQIDGVRDLADWLKPSISKQTIEVADSPHAR